MQIASGRNRCPVRAILDVDDASIQELGDEVVEFLLIAAVEKRVDDGAEPDAIHEILKEGLPGIAILH